MKQAQTSQDKKTTRKAFTLVELIIVIAIIGILVTTVLAGINFAKLKAQESKAKSELSQMAKKIEVAQKEYGSELRAITGSGCSECACRDGSDMRVVPDTHACYTGWRAARIGIAAEMGEGEEGFAEPVRDPWGSPYGLDENEGENPLDTCRFDDIRSFGADGIYNTADDIVRELPMSDPGENCP